MPRVNLSVKAVIFDMDGVITNTMPDHYWAWKTILHREDVKVDYFDIYTREGQKGIESVFELYAKYKKPVTLVKARTLLKQKEALFKKHARMRFVDGSRSFLKKLRRKNFDLALVTGTSRHEMQRILPSSIFELFDRTVTGSDVKKGKPHPEPFLKAIKNLNIGSTEAVVIENAPLGIRSAKEAGLKCIALTTSLPRKYLKMADYVFGSFREMEERVDFQWPGAKDEI